MKIQTLFPGGFSWLLCFALTFALPARAATPAPITDEECNSFGEELAGYFNAGKHAEAVRLLDGYALVGRITQGLEMEESDLNDFRAGYIGNVSKTLASSYSTFPSAHYLRAQTVDGERRLLVRCVSDKGAVNFMAFVPARRASGGLKWIDVYTYMNGELLSESSRRAILPLLAESKKNFLEKLSTSESNFVKSFPKATEAAKLIQEGKAAEAYAMLNALPADVRSHRFVLNLRLAAAQRVDEKEYLKVISDWEKAYPGDPSLDLISIDGDFMRKDYARGIKRLDSLSARLGGDNYLLFLKGNLQMMAGDNEAARKTARAVIAAEPALTSAWDTLLSISLSEKKYSETVTLLAEVEAMYAGAKMKPVIDKLEAYAEFRKSAEYKAWADKQAKSE